MVATDSDEINTIRCITIIRNVHVRGRAHGCGRDYDDRDDHGDRDEELGSGRDGGVPRGGRDDRPPPWHVGGARGCVHVRLPFLPRD